MSFARVLSRKSIHPTFKVGCVIVSDDNQRVLSIGINGDECGGDNCVDSTESGKSGCIHAEVNACLKIDFTDTCNKVVYVTLSPCVVCSRLLINLGVSKVVYDEPYRDTRGIDILRNAGIDVVSYDDVT